MRPLLGKWPATCIDAGGSEAVTMAYFERMRDVIDGPLTEEFLRQRADAGWLVASIEWRRELPGDAPHTMVPAEDIPYGLRISLDCQRLEFDPEESKVLLLMMELLVQDFSFSSVASDLNEKGYRTRAGKRWSQVSVFEMLPRLIEVGPRMFTTAEWAARRQHFSSVG
jgi:hypothetical protein